MACTGIICEYNPFHRGHAAMLEAVRSRGADAVVCAMSGNFVQRGEAALVSKFARAEMALRGGADLVLELPTPWAMATAEIFARGGVELLAYAGCDTIAFGSECGDAHAVSHMAQTLLRDDFPAVLRQELQSGASFAAARQRAAARLTGEAASLLENPNDILGVEYAKAVQTAAPHIALQAIRRVGVPHDGDSAGGIASASYIRRLLQSGCTEEACRYMPQEAAAVLQREIAAGRLISQERLDIAVLSRLRQMREADFAAYDGGNEGLYHRLYDAVHRGATAAEVLELAKTKRYSMARLRRMVLQSYLAVGPLPAHIPYLRVLAANEKGRAHLRTLQKAGVPVLTKGADAAALGAEAGALFAAEAGYTDQYLLGMAAPQKPGSEWRYTPLMA